MLTDEQKVERQAAICREVAKEPAKLILEIAKYSRVKFFIRKHEMDWSAALRGAPACVEGFAECDAQEIAGHLADWANAVKATIERLEKDLFGLRLANNELSSKVYHSEKRVDHYRKEYETIKAANDQLTFIDWIDAQRNEESADD